MCQRHYKYKKTMKKIILFFIAKALFSCKKNDETTNKSISDKTQDNKTIEIKDFKGKVTVMVMIYTSCKAACPRLVADMRDIESKMPKDKLSNLNFVLVSIDPEVDTPDRLKTFAKDNFMDAPHWTFLQGTKTTVQEFANVLAVKYKKIAPMDFSHSNIISVFDKEGVLLHQQEGLGVNNKETVDKIIETVNK